MNSYLGTTGHLSYCETAMFSSHPADDNLVLQTICSHRGMAMPQAMNVLETIRECGKFISLNAILS